ncbi:type II secretion system GspH family protein [Vibrio sp. JC009]|uniref:type IV pilus modification PilV family protein n=1 Tax=Vibrio sp. JC009 TaxID=2912314 RepID=UPI0023B0C18C|nr:type II secretion system protein [Vibrio sp. JC009]WED21541.1 type II secretion system GspH family protein [Vibrio sp. JC009]
MAAKSVKGFTLIESVIAIIIMAFAMLSLTSFLFPQVADSARPHYEVRASALAQSLMAEVLAKNFDELSDPDGGEFRCGEDPADCTAEADFGPDGESGPVAYNDVDDYIGTWQTDCASGDSSCNNLSDIFGNDISDEYANFTAEVAVVYEDNSDITLSVSTYVAKRITITITAGKYGDFSFSAYRGNY